MSLKAVISLYEETTGCLRTMSSGEYLEVTGWRQLHDEKPHSLYCLPDIVKMIQ
jgi:hypothetical protein